MPKGRRGAEIISVAEGIATVGLTRGMFAAIDESDIDIVSSYTWSYVAVPNSALGYAATCVDKKGILMHRLILGCQPGEYVDHRDGDGLNNRRNNLRICTHQENHRNRKARRGTRSGYKGVGYRNDRNTYRASINVDGKIIHLGSSPNAVEAARLYDAAAVKYFGEFARPNFPEGADHE